MNDREIAAACRALGDENRIRIIRILSSEELCACKILDSLEITQPTLSHHMKILAENGLVNVRKDGKWVYYSVNCTRFADLKAMIEKICCADSSQSSICPYGCEKGEI